MRGVIQVAVVDVRMDQHRVLAVVVRLIKDGSGRAICFFSRLIRTSDDTSRAHGYLGVRPDAGSTFMRTKFPELLY